jgi:hypothetical protein
MKSVVRYLAENTPNPFAGRKIAPFSVFWVYPILGHFARSTATNLLHFDTIY